MSFRNISADGVTGRGVFPSEFIKLYGCPIGIVCKIGAASVVHQSIDTTTTVAGNPAREIRRHQYES